jgi:hypothetical protein
LLRGGADVRYLALLCCGWIARLPKGRNRKR